MNFSFYTLTATHVRDGNICRAYTTMAALMTYSGYILSNHDDVQNVEIKQQHVFSDSDHVEQVYLVEAYSVQNNKYEQMYCTGAYRLIDLLKWIKEKGDEFEDEPTVTTLQVGYVYEPEPDGYKTTSLGQLLRDKLGKGA